MKFVFSFAMISALLISGCASTVTTYDASGKLIGTCKATSGFIVGAGAQCSGTANQEGKEKQ